MTEAEILMHVQKLVGKATEYRCALLYYADVRMHHKGLDGKSAVEKDVGAIARACLTAHGELIQEMGDQQIGVKP